MPVMGMGMGFGKLVDESKQSKARRRAHRPRKDYQVHQTVFDTLSHLKTALKQYIDSAQDENALPQYCSCSLTLSLTAVLPLKSPAEGPYADGGPNYLRFDEEGGNNAGGENDNVDDNGDDDENARESRAQTARRSVYDLCNIVDVKERQIWQRAAARGVVVAIQDLDGFKYSFNNNWTSKDDDGFRYSYTCLDSLENKDRHANGFRRTNAAKRRPGAGTRGVRKPTYDCKGQIAVKFSGVRQSVEVVYKHNPIHKTVAERKPPPRKDSRYRRTREGDQATDGAEIAEDIQEACSTDYPTSDLMPPSIVPASVPAAHPDAPIYPELREVVTYSTPYTQGAQAQQTTDPQIPSKTPRSTRGRPRKKAKVDTQARQPGQPEQPEQPEQPLSLVDLLRESMTGPEPAAQPNNAAYELPFPVSAVHNPFPVAPAPPQLPPQVASVRGRQAQTAKYENTTPWYVASQLPVAERDVGRTTQIKTACFACKQRHFKVINRYVLDAQPYHVCHEASC